MKNLTWQNPEQLFVAQELINKVKSKCCGIKGILISSAPQNRSGGASGMLGMARLTGQTTGASLVALMFVVFPVDGTYASLYFAGGFATLAAIVSFTRVSLPEPELLRGKAKSG